jgi:hypothetical protein
LIVVLLSKDNSPLACHNRCWMQTVGSSAFHLAGWFDMLFCLLTSRTTAPEKRPMHLMPEPAVRSTLGVIGAAPLQGGSLRVAVSDKSKPAGYELTPQPDTATASASEGAVPATVVQQQALNPVTTTPQQAWPTSFQLQHVQPQVVQGPPATYIVQPHVGPQQTATSYGATAVSGAAAGSLPFVSGFPYGGSTYSPHHYAAPSSTAQLPNHGRIHPFYVHLVSEQFITGPFSSAAALQIAPSINKQKLDDFFPVQGD